MGVEKKSISKVSLLIAVIMYLLYLLLLRHKSRLDIITLKESLKQVYSQINLLKQNHSRFILGLKKYPRLINGTTLKTFQSGIHLEMPLGEGPTIEYERVRRIIYLITKELWFYVKHQLSSVHNSNISLEHQRNIILEELANRKRWLLTWLEKVPALDGHEEWRRREAASLSGLVQRRLFHLQNPRDCRTAKTLICKPDIYGFGCNYHHYAYCLATAYDLGRVMHLPKRNIVFDKFHAEVFQPVSKTCTALPKEIAKLALGGSPKRSSLYLPPLRDTSPKRPYRIPKDLAQRLVRFSDDPYAWWAGQLVKYIMRLRKPEIVNTVIDSINFTSPIVGVHIRRTDKQIEAAFHDIEEYMSHVDDYYAQLELTRRVRRRIYLATDDVNVLTEAIAKYPQYTIKGDYFRTLSASVKSRNKMEGMMGITIDVHVLASCDYVVCTFSSNICRMAYELMQTRRVDAAARFTSLDDKYFYTFTDTHLRTAVMRSKKMSLEIGDLIQYDPIYNSRYYGMATVLRTKTTVYIPWFKTEEHYLVYPYPEFTQVPLDSDSTQKT